MLRNPILFTAACACLVIGCNQDSRENPDPELDRLKIPEQLRPKDKQALFMLRGEGVQIYEAADGKDGLTWVLRAPDATLLDYTTGKKTGTHTKGPTWTDEDGGRLVGKKIAEAPPANASAVPWLLLEVKSENGGRFAKVTHVQRVDTWGGRSPATKPAKATDSIEVRYEATYVFLGDR